MFLLGLVVEREMSKWEVRDDEEERLKFESFKDVTVKVGRWGR